MNWAMLPWVMAALMLASFVLLDITFHSITASTEAALANLQSVATAYGVSSPSSSGAGLVGGTEHWLHRTPNALKHFFDTVYPVMDDTDGCPHVAFVHGNSDTGGAVRAIESITTGMGWKGARDPVTVIGEPSRDDLDACWELGAMVAASLTM